MPVVVRLLRLDDRYLAQVVELVEDGGFVAQAEVEVDQVACCCAGGFGGSPVVLVGLKPGGVDGAVTAE